MDSLTPIYLPIELNRNGSWVRTILLYDLSGNPVDASHWTLAGAVKAAAGVSGGALATFTITPTPGADGQYLIELLGSDLNAVDGDQAIVRLAYDIRATRNTYPPEILLQGPVILNPGVTV